MRRFRRNATGLATAAALAACVLSSSPLPATAQQRPTDPRLVSILASAANRRWQVRLTTTDDSVFVGHVSTGSAGTTRIDDREIGIDGIRLLERRVVQGSGSRKGALIGGAVFGAVGFGFTWIGCALADSGCSGFVLPMGALLGGTFGATLGGAFGSLSRPGEYRWVREWPPLPIERRPEVRSSR